MTGNERRHLHLVPPPSSAEEDPEPPEPDDPEPPDEHLRVLLW
ncbi:hypothetical protein FHT40_004897 [Mycolicibacterium sp. BK556]|nr:MULTISPECIES: hypothetical protein [Mycobacteriaceae]MBB3605213.1 hypothetical protein [Mycolicibacterium sp. BK556]MBB3635409.1 hypothetical protein [Mycolicibacterium sp. BK607]MBB3747797.1 hypothetical protein [Mycolicibacterium sp. BK634]TDO08068.1 hypothetical protein EV580_5638 [Mycobacterium sp. BK086]